MPQVVCVRAPVSHCPCRRADRNLLPECHVDPLAELQRSQQEAQTTTGWRRSALVLTMLSDCRLDEPVGAKLV